MGDAEYVGRDHGGEGGQQEDNERADVTTLGQLWDSFQTSLRQVWDNFEKVVLKRQIMRELRAWGPSWYFLVKKRGTRSCSRAG